MKKILFGLAATASLVLTGCGGGSICDKFEDASKDMADKSEACSDQEYSEPTDAEKEACEKATENCTDADEEKVDAFLDCISDLDECKAGEETSYALQLLGCTGKLSGVSEACGVGGGVE